LYVALALLHLDRGVGENYAKYAAARPQIRLSLGKNHLGEMYGKRRTMETGTVDESCVLLDVSADFSTDVASLRIFPKTS